MHKQSKVLEYICQKLDKTSNNFVVIFIGATGSGKTYAAIDFANSIAKRYKTSFNIDDNVAFKFKQLLKIGRLEKNSKPGTPLIFEEVGAAFSGASARQWQSKMNMFFNTYLQTTRARRQVIVMTTPDFSNLEAGSRKLCDVTFQMLSIDTKNKKSQAKTLFFQVNRMSGKIYTKKLRYWERGLKKRIDFTSFDLPPKSMIERYEQRKKEFMNELDKMMEQYDDTPKSVKKPVISNERILELTEQGYNSTEIAERLGTTRQTINRRKKKILSSYGAKSLGNPVLKRRNDPSITR